MEPIKPEIQNIYKEPWIDVFTLASQEAINTPEKNIWFAIEELRVITYDSVLWGRYQ